MNRARAGMLGLVGLFVVSSAHGQCHEADPPYATIEHLTTPTKALRKGIPIRVIPDFPDLSAVETKTDVTIMKVGGKCNPKNVLASCSQMKIKETSPGKLSLFLTPMPSACSDKTSLGLTPVSYANGVAYLVSDRCGPFDLFVYLLDEDEKGNLGKHDRTIAKHYVIEAYDDTCRDERPDAGTNIGEWPPHKSIKAKNAASSKNRGATKKRMPPAVQLPRKFYMMQTDVGQGHEGHN